MYLIRCASLCLSAAISPDALESTATALEPPPKSANAPPAGSNGIVHSYALWQQSSPIGKRVKDNANAIQSINCHYGRGGRVAALCLGRYHRVPRAGRQRLHQSAAWRSSRSVCGDCSVGHNRGAGRILEFRRSLPQYALHPRHRTRQRSGSMQLPRPFPPRPRLRIRGARFKRRLHRQMRIFGVWGWYNFSDAQWKLQALEDVRFCFSSYQFRLRAWLLQNSTHLDAFLLPPPRRPMYRL